MKTLSPEIVAGLADRLDEAERTRRQVDLFSMLHPGMTIDDSYAVQATWVERKIARGNPLIGHKIGLTSRAMQRLASIDEPDYGTLLADMLFRDGGDLPSDRFIVPKVEVELAFILKAPLRGPACTIYDVLGATDYIVPALEIIDARIHRADPKTRTPRKVLDTIADNAANAGIVLGGRPVKPDAVDLRWVSALLFRNGVIEDTGVAAAVLGHPANGVAWLANKLHAHGVALAAGEIVLGGSFTSAIEASPGDTFHVDYGPLGSIGCRFA